MFASSRVLLILPCLLCILIFSSSAHNQSRVNKPKGMTYNMTQEYLNRLLQLIAENRLREFYLSSEWRTLSERIISEQKECQICKENHRWGPAQIVHHVNYLRNNPELALSRFDRDGRRNLIAVCIPCHNRIHGASSKKYRNPERW